MAGPARANRVLLIVLMVVPAILVPLAAIALTTAGPSVAATKRAQATLAISTLDPDVGARGKRLHAAGVVLNTGTLRLSDLVVNLRLSETPLSSRAELAAVAAGRTDSRQGQVVSSQRLPTRLRPGERAGFDLGVALSDVSFLGSFGVHVLTVEVRASSTFGFGRVGVVRSFLPWAPDPREYRATGFSWLWPVGSRPRKLAQANAFVDDGLAEELAPGGRLARLVSAGQQIAAKLPVSWVVDPTVLDDARAMTAESYTYAAPGSGKQVKGAGGAAAAQWLEQIKAATLDQSVVTLPYGDPDLAALRRAGLTGDLTRAHLEGANVTADVLGGTPTSDIAWPASGFADTATLAALRKDGFTAVLLSADAVPPAEPPNATPTGRANLRTASGPATALLYDPTLARTLAPPGAASPVLSARRFLAETAMITAETPSVGRTRKILIAPPRQWAPGPEFLDRIVAATLAAPWIGGVDLDALRSAAPPELARARLRYPQSVRAAELSSTYVGAVKDMVSDIALFAAVLSAPALLVAPLDHAVFRLESAWWRGRDEQRGDRLSLERRHLTALRELIKVSPGSYTFGSRSGTIPVTVVNGLDQDVTVRIELIPRNAKLSVDNTSVEPTPIGANRKVQLPVAASARASGRVAVETQLLTPAGLRYDNQSVDLNVNITQFGTAALFVTMGAAGVLLLVGAARVARRVIAGGGGRGRGRGFDRETAES